MNLLDETEEEAYDRKLQQRVTRMTLKMNTVANRQLERLQKQMDFYDQQTDCDILNINDFRKLQC